jgi:hypothetical protein
MHRRLETHKDWRIVIPDVRFDNEAELIWQSGGVVIKLQRDAAAPVNEHVSEAGVSDDFVHSYVANNGDIGQLHTAVLGVLEKLS